MPWTMPSDSVPTRGEGLDQWERDAKLNNPTIKKVFPAQRDKEPIPGPALGNQLRKDRDSCASRAIEADGGCASRATGSKRAVEGQVAKEPAPTAVPSGSKAAWPGGPKKDHNKTFILDCDFETGEVFHPKDRTNEPYSSKEDAEPNCPNLYCDMNVTEDQLMSCELCRARGCIRVFYVQNEGRSWRSVQRLLGRSDVSC